LAVQKRGGLGGSKQQKTPAFTGVSLHLNWLRGLDLNQRPSGYEPDANHSRRTRIIANTHGRILRFSSHNFTLKTNLVSLLYHLLINLRTKKTHPSRAEKMLFSNQIF